MTDSYITSKIYRFGVLNTMWCSDVNVLWFCFLEQNIKIFLNDLDPHGHNFEELFSSPWYLLRCVMFIPPKIDLNNLTFRVYV